MDPLLATILLWPVSFAPRGWAFCAGQILSISTNTALFSLLGTTYGGNGQTTFQLPDFRGRLPIGAGSGPGRSPYDLGQAAGTESVILTTNNLPSHMHSLSITIQASNAQATDSVPSATVNTPAAPYDTTNFNAIAGFNNQAPNTTLNVGTLPTGTGLTGNTLPFSILQPYLAVNYIIALEGVFPSRN